MRKVPRGFPIIGIANRQEIIEEFGDVNSCSNAYYMTNPNVVEFNNCKFQSEEYCIQALYHELNHWAQFMFLDSKEMSKHYRVYTNEIREGNAPFVEWINPIRGFYDYSMWQEKYKGRKFTFDLEIEEELGRPKTIQRLLPWIYKHKRKDNRW